MSFLVFTEQFAKLGAIIRVHCQNKTQALRFASSEAEALTASHRAPKSLSDFPILVRTQLTTQKCFRKGSLARSRREKMSAVMERNPSKWKTPRTGRGEKGELLKE